MKNMIFLSVAFLMTLTTLVKADPTNSTWNYDLNGTDWKMGYCGDKDYPLAPADVNRNDPALDRDWLPYRW